MIVPERRRARPRPERPSVAATRDARKAECIAGGCALLVRVSSSKQAEESLGSIDHQRSQRNQVKRHGGDPGDVVVYEHLGQSAKRGKARPDLARLTEDVARGRIRTIILGWTSRIARAWERPIEDLFEALTEARGGIIAQGRFYDLNDFEDLARLRQQINEAEKQNSERAEMAASACLQRAHELKLLVPLPTGLVCADPRDPAFRKEMEREGVQDALSEEALGQHKTDLTSREGQFRAIFPDPRQGTHRAIKYLGQAVLLHGSIAAALEAVDTASPKDYPRPGFLPATQGSLYCPVDANGWSLRKEKKKKTLRWRRISDSPDGRAEWAFRWVREFLFSPALYGIYSYESPVLEGKAAVADDRGTDVWEIGAFPGLFTIENYTSMTTIAKDPARRLFRSVPLNRPRTNLVARLRCAHPLPNGEVCGLTVGPSFASDRRAHTYVNATCGVRGHASTYPPGIDDTITELLVAAFTQERVRGELRVTVEEDDSLRTEVQRLEQEIAEEEAHVPFAAREARAAEARNDAEDKKRWLQDRRETIQKVGKLNRQLADLRFLLARQEPVLREEREAILELVRDFPRLLALAREQDNLAPILTTPLITEVQVRRIGTGHYWLGLQLPTGKTVTGTHRGVTPDSTPGMRARAHAALLPHLDVSSRQDHAGEATCLDAAGELAEAWNRILHDHIAHGDWPHWDGERVLGVAYDFDADTDLCSESADLRTVAAWAESLAVDPDLVWAKALAGELGRPALRDGSLVWTLEEGVFPPVAVVADVKDRSAGADDLVEVAIFAFGRGLNPRRVEEIARDAGLATEAENGTTWVLEDGLATKVDRAQLSRLAEGGDWLTFAYAEEQLPGVTRKPLERVAPTCAPQRGLTRHRQFWVDDEVQAALRNETVHEALERLGLPDRRRELHLETSVRAHFRDRAGFRLSKTAVRHAVRKERVVAFPASDAPYGSVRWRILVPADLWEAPTESRIRRWLRGQP